MKPSRRLAALLLAMTCAPALGAGAAGGDGRGPISLDSQTAATPPPTVSMRISGFPVIGVTRPGDVVRFRFDTSRFGAAAGLEPRFETTLPETFTFVAIGFSGAGTSCDLPSVGSAGAIRCLLPDAGSSSLVRVDLDVRIAESTPTGQLLSLAATVASNGVDGSPGDNLSAATLVVQSGQEVADLQVSIEADRNPIRVGDPLQLTIVLDNAGPDYATWVTLSFFTPSAVYAVAPHAGRPVPGLWSSRLAWPEGWDCMIPNIPPPVLPNPPVGYLCRIPILPPGRVTLTWSGTVRADVIGPITLSATATTTSTDPAAGNSAAQLGVPIEHAAALIPATQSLAAWLLALLIALIAARGILQRH